MTFLVQQLAADWLGSCWSAHLRSLPTGHVYYANEVRPLAEDVIVLLCTLFQITYRYFALIGSALLPATWHFCIAINLQVYYTFSRSSSLDKWVLIKSWLSIEEDANWRIIGARLLSTQKQTVKAIIAVLEFHSFIVCLAFTIPVEIDQWCVDD